MEQKSPDFPCSETISQTLQSQETAINGKRS